MQHMILKNGLMSLLFFGSVTLFAGGEHHAWAGDSGFVQRSLFDEVTPSFPLERRFLALPAIGLCAAAAVVAANASPQALRGLCKIALIEPASMVGFFVGYVAYCQQLTTYVYGVGDLVVGALGVMGLFEKPGKNLKRGIASLALGVPLSVVATYYCDVASAGKAANFAALNPLHAFGK